MRDVFTRMLEQVEMLGFDDVEFFENWIKGALFGLSVEDAPAPIVFARDSRMECIFQVLKDEGLITKRPDYNGPEVLGQLSYELTESGQFLAEQAYLEYLMAHKKHS